MASFVTYVCDRCKAQFPGDTVSDAHKKLHPNEIKRSYSDVKIALCDRCNELFSKLLREFKEGK